MYDSIYKSSLFDGKVVIVTGGGSGIGRCTAHELATLGAHVIIIGRSIDKLEKVADEITKNGNHYDFYSLDIRDSESIREVLKTIIKKYGQLDGLVNNAGGQFPSSLEDISDNGWDAVIRNNLNGGFYMMREAYNLSMKEHGGSIVNIVACVAHGMPQMGHTGAARAGMINLTQTAALECGPFWRSC